MLLVLEAIGRVRHEGVDAPHTRADGAFGEQRDPTNMTGGGHMGSAAQLLIEILTDGDHAHVLAVLLSE